MGVRFVHGYEDEVWKWRMGDGKGRGLREEKAGMGSFGDYAVDWVGVGVGDGCNGLRWGCSWV